GHLPEAKFAWQPLAEIRAPRVLHLPQLPAIAPAIAGTASLAEAASVAASLARPPLVRRVFRAPQPLPPQSRSLHDDGWLIYGATHGAVTHTAGPHVVSGGWWIREVHREYQFALTRRGTLLWVYYDRPRRRFFLHGRVE
ncbi:MAG: hypothetical protein L0Z55_07585, partial [Planctomycetes bacterium]|nr:hypothetical protein [Planctomycetota bacterium]